MTTPKFKIGDRVKWCDSEGLADLGEVALVRPAKRYGYQYKMTDGLWWHESHLSLDVPEPKKHATDREAGLGVEIIDLIKKCSSQAKSIEHLSNRLTEEIDGRARERIAKEAAQEKLAASDIVADCQQKELWFAQQSLAIEQMAKESARNELADVRQDLADLRKDLADLRTISERLAL